MTNFDEAWLAAQLAKGRRITSPSGAGKAGRGVHTLTGTPPPSIVQPAATRGYNEGGHKVPAEREADFQAAVIEYAHLRGWKVATFRPARRGPDGTRWSTPVGADGAGWPDLFLARPGRVIAAELKSAKGQLRGEQKAWLALLGGAGIDAYCWRPADWETIKKVLESRPAAATGRDGRNVERRIIPGERSQRHAPEECRKAGDLGRRESSGKTGLVGGRK